MNNKQVNNEKVNENKVRNKLGSINLLQHPRN